MKDFINETKDTEERKYLLEKYFQITAQMKKLSNDIFDENDGFSRNTIDKIKDTERVIKEFNTNRIDLINVFVHIIDIIANVEKIILGWKTGNVK